MTPLNSSAIDQFSYQRPYNKLGPDGSEEVWVEKTILTTEDVFPTVLRRSEVTDVQVQEFSPVEIALKEVQERTQKLASLNERYAALVKTSQNFATTPLSMELNRAVDAPPGTGIAVFRQTLLSPDYVARFPDRAEQLDSLRVAIDDQVCSHPADSRRGSLYSSLFRFALSTAVFVCMAS